MIPKYPATRQKHNHKLIYVFDPDKLIGDFVCDWDEHLYLIKQQDNKIMELEKLLKEKICSGTD